MSKSVFQRRPSFGGGMLDFLSHCTRNPVNVWNSDKKKTIAFGGSLNVAYEVIIPFSVKLHLQGLLLTDDSKLPGVNGMHIQHPCRTSRVLTATKEKYIGLNYPSYFVQIWSSVLRPRVLSFHILVHFLVNLTWAVVVKERVTKLPCPKSGPLLEVSCFLKLSNRISSDLINRAGIPMRLYISHL